MTIGPTRIHAPRPHRRVRLILALLIAFCGTASSRAADSGGSRPADDTLLSQANGKPLTLLVGPKRLIRLPSEAAIRARDGDTVEIDAGTYVDCAVWRANRLTIRAVGGEVHVRDKSCEGKGIWVVYGDQLTIDGIRFSGASVPDRNGAGIRSTGASLTVRRSTFEWNENGILTNADPNGRILVEDSTFIGNGKCEPHCAHGIYIGDIASLEVRNSTFRNQRIGHHIKSRAGKTVVTGNLIEDGEGGTASYLIDVPWGGEILIANNRMQKGALTDNRTTAISIAAEGLRHATPSIRIGNNDFRSDVSAPEPVVFVRNMTPTPAVLTGNRICGQVTPLAGPGYVDTPRACN